jgi:hypothetical protein
MPSAVSVAARVLRDSFWRPLLALLRAWRVVVSTVAILGLTAQFTNALAWVAALPPLAWVAAAGWIAAALVFYRTYQLQRTEDEAERRLGLVRDRQAVIDQITKLLTIGEPHLTLSAPSGFVEPHLRRWTTDVREYLAEHLGSDRANQFDRALAQRQPPIPPNCPDDRVRQIRQLQGKVDYLNDLLSRLVALGPRE